MQTVIEFSQVSYSYRQGYRQGQGLSGGHKALDGITLTICRGECIGIVGANGSGKSTLVQHMNGLLSPDSGEVAILGGSTLEKRHREGLWRKVGLLFQYPEHQLFEATVFDDVAYGLRNMGIGEEEVSDRTREAMGLVGLDVSIIAALPPYALSGGQRRRAAIAGILAMRPEILILDEPTAGLDGPGRSAIMSLVKRLQLERGTTVVLVSHSMREVMTLADRIAVLRNGRLLAWGKAGEVMQAVVSDDEAGLVLPEFAQILYGLAGRGLPVSTQAASREEALSELIRLVEEEEYAWGKAGAVRSRGYLRP